MTDRILIWGAGAIGGTMGAYVARAGAEITFVDIAADHVAAIRDGGLRITGPIENFVIAAPAFTRMTRARSVVPSCATARHGRHAPSPARVRRGIRAS